MNSDWRILNTAAPGEIRVRCLLGAESERKMTRFCLDGPAKCGILLKSGAERNWGMAFRNFCGPKPFIEAGLACGLLPL